MEEETWREGVIERMTDGGRDMERGSVDRDEPLCVDLLFQMMVWTKESLI